MFRTDLRLVFDCIRFSNDKERLYQIIQENENYHQLDEDVYDVIARYARVFGDKKMDVLEGGKVDMCKAMQELRADWIAEGKAEGKAEECRDFIFEFLKELGSISEGLTKRITQECDLRVLREWSRLAARVISVQEFEAGIY